ncbi:ABC transporter related protein [Denitrovibrio acetiphilus DSM 12809]|uniref:ABC transporter related protein n=1 Tax=Denitrovibrio acetiphilus (strain DSM 12809 / NBRC 114555 / N2460) TaxID=522772 RepID=D4H5H9_DENA2|nr:ABC transporter ATP-binding protein [Denitrovibrio acetiphilus]ADD67599.1 ABC transporter related protein [Denitrovibrio acetiphilus DSM 12809]
MKYFSCENLISGYNKKPIIKNISISFGQSNITSVIGPNGSGKSTLLKTMGRLIKPFSGKVYINDKTIDSYSAQEIACNMGILPQAPTAPMDTPVHCLVSYGRNPHKKLMSKFDKTDRDTVDWAIESTGLKDKRFKRLGQLSGGERQRAWIAMALAQQPKTLLLDEPTTYLDVHHQFEVLELLEKLNRECGLTVIMVLHDLNLASRFSHRIIALKDGTVCKDGTPQEVMTEENISGIFNVRSTVLDVNNNRVAVPMGVA